MVRSTASTSRISCNMTAAVQHGFRKAAIVNIDRLTLQRNENSVDQQMWVGWRNEAHCSKHAQHLSGRPAITLVEQTRVSTHSARTATRNPAQSTGPSQDSTFPFNSRLWNLLLDLEFDRRAKPMPSRIGRFRTVAVSTSPTDATYSMTSPLNFERRKASFKAII